jgi:hypothetical protein
MASYDPEHVYRSQQYDKRAKRDKKNTDSHNQLERDYSSGKITKKQYDARYKKLSSHWKTKEARSVDEGAGRVKKERRSTSSLKGRKMKPVKRKSTGISKKGFRVGMAKLMKKGYSKQQAYDSMKGLAKMKQKSKK